MPSAAGFTACQTSTYGWPATSTCGSVTAGDDPALLAAGHQVVDQHAEPPGRPRPERPDQGDQLVDAVQRLDHDRLDPQVVAPDPLDQRRVVPPSTQIRLPRATRAGPSGTAREPEAVRPGRRGCGVAGRGRVSVTGRPSSRKPAAVSGNSRRRPRRSSSVTASFAHSTTAPQKPSPATSTTRSRSAGTSGTTARLRHSPARTSGP